ncbi:hypothetical protein [Brevundimonas sp. 374]|uniref:hypothetical protein n=1 Tax=Brevundimonas sp. 374 TaxID=1150400 RepID=UPI00088500B2|nr:hypothetical protein [Brevundimonas sp. 374]SDR11547.1 hypothetical protein SAMN02787020_2704 [Brevundimonas sp. 374]
MLQLALISAVALEPAIQTTGLLEATPETYRAPAVRPYQPPSRFGRETAEGDGEIDLHRRPLTAPVAVDDYAGDYEFSPSDSQTTYDQGVAQAAIDAEAAMGPLDGRWRIAQPDGKPLLSLSLTDRGEGRRVEGAWRRLDAPAGVDRTGFAGPVSTQGEVVVIPLSEGELHLHPAADSWAGEWIRDGRARRVTATRPG